MENADKVIEKISEETLRSLTLMGKSSDNAERLRQSEIVKNLTDSMNNIFAGLESLTDTFSMSDMLFEDDDE